MDQHGHGINGSQELRAADDQGARSSKMQGSCSPSPAVAGRGGEEASVRRGRSMRKGKSYMGRRRKAGRRTWSGIDVTIRQKRNARHRPGWPNPRQTSRPPRVPPDEKTLTVKMLTDGRFVTASTPTVPSTLVG